MKVIKPNTDWLHKITCQFSDALLEITTEDLQHIGWYGYVHGDVEEPDGDRFYIVCPVCSNTHDIDEKLIPTAVQFVVPKNIEYD